jgi:hypothetical protein
MSKLTETLSNNVQNHLENITIRFSTQQLDQDLLNQLGIYLCTKASEKLIETALALTCGYYMDIDKAIISQIKYKPAQKLENIISQRLQGETEKKLQKVDVPRWIVLIVGSTEIYSANHQNFVTVEDAINVIFKNVTKTLNNKIQESSGNLTHVTIRFYAERLDQDLLNQLRSYLCTESSVKLIETAFAMTSGHYINIEPSIIDHFDQTPISQLLNIVSQSSQSQTENNLQQTDIPQWMVKILYSKIYPENALGPLATVEDVINTVFRLCINLLKKPLGNNDGKTTKKAS